jgi:hypothetical protein
MRQAGRSLPEYRALRKGRTLLELARTPELTAEVTLQPVRRHEVDAAILFSDIVVPLASVGVELEIRPGVGPVIAAPIRTAADVRQLRALEPDEDLPEVADAVRLLCAELDVPLIGFAGGPFTLASYLIEGGPSKTQARTKAMMLGQPALFRDLLDRLAAIAAASLRAQVVAPLPDSTVERMLVARFADAFESGDIEGVVALLTDDALLTMPPEPIEYQGPDAIAGFFATVPAGGELDRFRLVPTRANGQPAFACYLRDPHAPIAHAYGLMVLTLSGGRLAAITGFPDTSVFPHFGLPRTLRE